MVSLVTDYDSWRQPKPPSTPREEKSDPFVLLQEITANLQAASASAITLMQRAVELMSSRREALLASPAQQALKLGIWSEKSKIPRDQVQRLAPLWMKYFEGIE